MKNISVAIWVEYMKIRKSKVFYTTIIVFTIIPLMTGLMMFVAKNPEIAARLGIVGTKSKMFSENDWTGYLDLLCQAMASVGLIGFGFVTSWIFGREHSDRTMKDILSLPISRQSIVIAKFIISFSWCILLSLEIYSIGILLGHLMDIPGWSKEVLAGFSRTFWGASFLTLLLGSPVAFLAGYSRGVIAPLGFTILTLILANFVGVIGLGPYFPWAVPGLFAVGKDTEGLHLLPSSYIILGFTFCLGYWATWHWWRKADHH
jgi:ABC-2 type transport system permease protein